MRPVEFRPSVKRDVALLHKDGFYLDKVPKKIGGPEKVGQMCGIILINRLNIDRELKTVPNYEVIPLIVGLLVENVKNIFENTGENPDENLKDLVVEDIILILPSKALEIRLGVYTEAGGYAPLHLRIPLYGNGKVDQGTQF